MQNGSDPNRADAGVRNTLVRNAVVPSKVFLMGEYTVLENFPALVAAISPRQYFFSDASTSAASTSVAPLSHPESPLGRWLSSFQNEIDQKVIPKSWSSGTSQESLSLGLGTSTAELCAAWSQQQVPSTAPRLLAWYREQFPKQSGADLMVQLHSMSEGLGVYLAHPTAGTIQSIKLGRVAQQLFLFKASPQKKLATHEAVRSYTQTAFDRYKIDFLMSRIVQLLELHELTPDFKVLTEWAQELASFGFETEWARRVREGATQIKGVLGCKGCGAGMNDVFWVAFDSSRGTPSELEAWAASEGLQPMGSLWDLTRETTRVAAFAPVNIAWIKYMGKTEGTAANASYSLTLDRIGSLTVLTQLEDLGLAGTSRRLEFRWNRSGYVPPEKGQEKIEKYLRDERIWVPMLNRLGYLPRANAGSPAGSAMGPMGTIEIWTQNSAPAGTGIATSASGFAAIALAWSALHLDPQDRTRFIQTYESNSPEGARHRLELARAASLGSGSAGRSIEGPWVCWNPKSEVPFQPVAFDSDWVDLILLLETEHKKVSSSEAHVRVKTSPLFEKRLQNLGARIHAWAEAFHQKKFDIVKKLTLEESVEMHELFHTSEPPFGYWNEHTRRWLHLAREGTDLPSQEFVITMDAGANLHWFVRPRELKLWRSWLKFKDPKLKWIEGRAGAGALYLESI